MSGPIRVLHVDDEPDFADVAAQLLERENDRLTVETATSASDGLDRLVADAIDCIVSDYDMPGMDGLAFLETVRTDYNGLPFILFTGKGSETVASEAISAGVTDYLQKTDGPDQYAILANRIRNAVDRARAHQQRQRQLDAIETAQEGISILDEDGHFVYVNEAYAELYGYEPDEMLGEHWEVLYPDDQVAFAREHVLPAVAEEGSWHGETTGLRADGSTFVEDHVVATSDQGELICAVRDITEHKERERELERNQDLLSTMQRIADIGAWELDPQTEDLVWTEGIPRIYEEDEDFDPTFEEALAYFHPEDREFVRQRIEKRLEAGGSGTDKLRIVTANDNERWIEAHSEVVEQEGTRLLRGYMQDITERHQYEQAVTALHEVADDLAACTTADEAARRTIEAAEALLQFDRSVVAIEEGGHLEVRAASGVLSPENYGRMRIDEGIAGKTYRMGQAFRIDDLTAHEAAKPQGPFRSVLSLPIGEHGIFQAVGEAPGAFDDHDLELARLLVTHTESTLDRLQRKRELERQNERLEAFANMVSHDLRNPLEVAIAGVEVARTECDSDHLDAIDHALGRMDALVEDVLTLARQGHPIDETEAIPLSMVSTQGWRMIDMGKADLEFERDTTLRGDPDRVQQLLENLFRNAIEHGGEDVTIRAGALEEPTGFYVADDGAGIPPDERSKVFDSGYSTASDGTGFGLAIVEEIVDAHGWTITVTDSNDGGARFEITGVETDQ